MNSVAAVTDDQKDTIEATLRNQVDLHSLLWNRLTYGNIASLP